MENKVISMSGSEMVVLEFSKLPIDLWYTVFSHLPKKTLLELRCVSKSFCSFITELFIPRLATSAFISGFIFHWYTVYVYPQNMLVYSENHKRYSPTPPNSRKDFITEYFHDYVAFYRGRNGCLNREFINSYVSMLPFKMATAADTMDRFLGCFNGFILCVTNNCYYYLCNPATKQCINVPVNPQHLNYKLEGGNKKIHPFVGLAFDPLDPPPYHFKIFRFNTTTSLEELDVFYSATGEWVKHGLRLDHDEIQRFELMRRSVYLKGILYMLSTANYLLCFDLRESYNNDNYTDVKLKVRAIKLPHTSTMDDNDFGLFESSNRCLYYAIETLYELLIWTFQVKNEASTWLLKYRINIYDLKKLTNGSPLNYKKYMVYAVNLSEEIIIFGSSSYIWSYHVNTNKLCILCCLNSGTILCARNCFYPYSCCLVKLADKVFIEPEPSYLA